MVTHVGVDVLLGRRRALSLAVATAFAVLAAACAPDWHDPSPRSPAVSPTPHGGATDAALLQCLERSPLLPNEGQIEARLTTADGAPLPGREVRWSGGDGNGFLRVERSHTDAIGIAKNDVIVPWDLGTTWQMTVTVAFAGEAVAGPAECTLRVQIISPGLPQPPASP